MAILTGAIKYRGSFKSIRNWTNLYDPKVYAGEKGGATRDQIMTNPVFARTRENLTEFAGCGAAVKSIRRGLLNLLPEQTDKQFTGRLMKLVREINRRDYTGLRGQRSILFSANRNLLKSLVFNVQENSSAVFQHQITLTHPVSRISANLTTNGLVIKPVQVPRGAGFFRLQHHLSVVSDWVFNELDHRYEPLAVVDGLEAFAYSEYSPVGTPLTVDLEVALPTGTVVGDECTVMQCVGIEFFAKSGAAGYLPMAGSCMVVADLF